MSFIRKIEPITILQGLKCLNNDKAQIFNGEIEFNKCELNIVQYCILNRADECLK